MYKYITTISGPRVSSQSSQASISEQAVAAHQAEPVEVTSHTTNPVTHRPPKPSGLPL